MSALRVGLSRARLKSAVGGRFGNLLDTLGEMGSFAWRAIASIRYLRPFAAETLRQASILATGSVLIIMLANFFIGAAGAQLSLDGARALGAEQFGAINTATYSIRQVTPFLFGFILAAKVGCGFVAEIGSMIVREEVEALDTLGIRSLSYLVATRLVAAMFVMPIAFVLSLGAAQFGAFLQNIRFRDISLGSFEYFFYNLLKTTDPAFAILQATVVTLVVVLVALFYGWRVSGGPVEVGEATARSMAVGLGMTTAVNLLFTIAYSVNNQLPIA